ncbi:MAG: hypothetical protein WED33_10440 [Bacteroidia bacterium]
MKKLLYVLSTVAIVALTACGPSAEEMAEKEKMRADSIAASEAMEQARMDSMAAAEAMEMARMDSIAAAEAMAAEEMAKGSKGGSKPKAPAAPKEEPKAAEPVKKGGMKGGADDGTSETPKSGETPVKKGGMKGGMK